MGRNKKFTEETYQQIKDKNNKENPFDINEHNRLSMLDWFISKKGKQNTIIA